MPAKEILFRSKFTQKELSSYDWNSLATHSMSGNLKDLCDNLSQCIHDHNIHDNFTSHSNLYDIMNNLFCCYLSWKEGGDTLPIHPLFASLHIDISSKVQLLMLNILSLHWQHIKRLKSSNKKQYELYRHKYECLVQALSALIDPILLKTKLNAEASHSLKLFTKLKLPKTKDIDPISTLDRRRKTRMYYVQNKFNLLIEESEGFAKLMTEIAEHLQQTQYKQSKYTKHNIIQETIDINDGSDTDDDDVDMNEENENKNNDGAHKVLENKIFELIGQFKLDPNRVIDILLHGLEFDVNNTSLLKILRHNFIASNIVTILGFRFRYYQTKKGNKPTPKSLYRLTVYLIHFGIIKLPDILAHLSVIEGNDKTTLMEIHIKDRKQFERNEKERAKLINYVNLNDSLEEKETRKKAEQELYRKREEYHTSHKSSQIFELLVIMIECGDWKHCAEYLSILSEAKCESKHYINCALMKLLQQIISPLYSKYCSIWSVLSINKKEEAAFNPLDESLICDDLLSVPGVIGPIIAALNVYLHRGPILFGAICRILSVIMSGREECDDNTDIEDIIYGLMSSYSLIENNSGLSYDLWHLLSWFSYSYRFKFYGYWRDFVYSFYSELWCRREDAIKDTKYLLRRYHVDDSNQKKLGRMFARYIDCHPVLVFELVLAQLQAYSGNVGLVVDGFRYLTHLDRDVLIWCILVFCEAKNTKIRRDTYYSDWFRALCDIVGQFYCSINSHECDLKPILFYVLNKLLMGYADHLLIFSGIIQKLTQIEAFGEVITYKQLSCLAGSQLLSQVVLQLDNKYSHYKHKKTIKKLSKTLISNRLIIPLFVLLNNVNLNLSFGCNNNTSYFDTIPTQCDITNDAFVQLFLFMKHHMKHHYFTSLYDSYPSLNTLFVDCKMKVSYSFMLSRLFKKELIMDVHDIETIFKDKNVFKYISPAAYCIFWSLEINDIYVPNDEYDREIKRQEELSRQYTYSSMNDKEKCRKLKKDKKNAEEICNQLVRDKKEQNVKVKANIAQVFNDTEKEWFYSDKRTHQVFLFECILPRLNTSDIDAKYAATFIQLMIDCNIKKFYLMDFTKILLLNFNQILSCSTYSESRRLGRFLADFMLILEKYRENKQIDMCETFNQITYDDFCTQFRSMHRSLTIYLVHLMQSNNILWQKNSILVLNEVQCVFPRVLSHAKHLKAKVSIIKSNTIKGTSMAILCERVIAILEKGINNDDYLDEQKFGGRNLGNKDKEIVNNDKINELRRKALESQMKIGQKRRFSQIAPKEEVKEVKKQKIVEENRDRPRVKTIKKTTEQRSNSERSNKYRERERNGSSAQRRASSSNNKDNRSRERDRDNRSSRDRDRERDRGDRDRDRENRDRDRDRERERERDRDRDRDRERDRDRNRERDQKRDRDNKNGDKKDEKDEKTKTIITTTTSTNYDKKDRDRNHRDNKRRERHRR